MTRKHICLAALVLLALVTILVPFAYARYYHPTLGRFINRDPNEYVDGLNLYNYTGNNPIVLTDPTGGCAADYTETPEVNENAPCKCFCVDSVSLQKLRPTDPAREGRVGYHFTVTISGQWKDWNNLFKPFKFEWWEWFKERALDYPAYLEPGQWNNIYAAFPSHPAFEDVNLGITGTELKEQYTVRDAPGTFILHAPGGASRGEQATWFAVHAISSCPKEMCKKPEDADFGYHYYKFMGNYIEANEFTESKSPMSKGTPW